MKKLLFGMLIAVSGLVFYACSQKTGILGAGGLKTNANDLVATESKVDNIIETTSDESDLFSLGSSSAAAFSVGLKSGDMAMGGGAFKNMFDHFPNFKLRYLGGICPDLMITTTNGGFPKTMTINYGTGLEMANGHVLKGKIR